MVRVPGVGTARERILGLVGGVLGTGNQEQGGG
jgi:hypothetical protein